MAENLPNSGAYALEIITWLVNEIGPRPAGSAAERKAQDGLTDRLHTFNYETKIIPTSFAPAQGFEPIRTFSAAAFIACTWLLPVFPWPAFILPILAIELPEVDALLERRRPATLPTQNLLAYPLNTKPSDLDLVLVAHVDTAQANPRNGFWRNLDASAFPAMQRIGWIIAILGIITLAGFSLPSAIHYAAWLGTGLLALGLIGLDIWELANRRSGYVPGAVDNASGVGALMAIARNLAKGNDTHQKIGFLFTGAEETGMHGATGAAEWFKKLGANPRFLVVDQVGAGDKMRFARQVGRLHPLKTTPDLNHLLARADPLIEPLDYIRRSGDFEAFLRAGFAAASLEMTGSQRAQNAYHTQNDNLSMIDIKSVSHTIDVLLQVLWILEKSKN